MRAEVDATSDRPYDIVIEGNGSEHSPAAWADAGATWWIESMWDAVGQAEPVLADPRPPPRRPSALAPGPVAPDGLPSWRHVRTA